MILDIGAIKLRILYITNFWSGLKDIILDGKNEASGMPAFFYPLQFILNDKSNIVDFVVLTNERKELNINVKWLNNSLLQLLENKPFLFILPKLLYIIIKGKYDFIYCHGSIASFWGNIASILLFKPCGVRFYGTFLVKFIDNPSILFLRKNLRMTDFLDIIVYNLPKKFLLTTNDGTKGDCVYSRFCLMKGFYKHYFWLNGVDYSLAAWLHQSNKQELLKNEKFIYYPARYDRWKRQDYAIEILELLHKKGYILHMIFSGHVYDNEYFQELKNKVEIKGLNKFIQFHKEFSKNEMIDLINKSFMIFSLYDYSNLGNVVIEAAMLGAIVLSRNDGSLNFLIENNESGILINNSAEAVESIINLYNNPSTCIKMKENIRTRANTVFIDWDKRSSMELDLLTNLTKNEK